MIAVALATIAFTTPPSGLRALGTRAPGTWAPGHHRRCAVLLQAGADSNDIDTEISLAARVDERWKFLRDNPGMDAAEAADNSKANLMQRSKDTRLAERDTRQWCLDRCLATGYCEARLPCPPSPRMDPPLTLPRGWLVLEFVLGLEFSDLTRSYNPRRAQAIEDLWELSSKQARLNLTLKLNPTLALSLHMHLHLHPNPNPT